MPRWRSIERIEANAAALRSLVDAGSSSVIRDPMEGGAISGTRRRWPIPGIGHRSGKLTVTGYMRGVRGGFSALIVQCDCGRPEYTVGTHSFKAFRTTRCNICALEKTQQHRRMYYSYIKDMAEDNHRARLLNRLSAAIVRCHNPKARYFHHYGGRGIEVYKGWRDDRGEFLRYVQTIPGWDVPQLELDRINVNGNYEPGNIRFLSKAENNSNKRRIADLEAEITLLREEVAGLRHRLSRAETQIYGVV